MLTHYKSGNGLTIISTCTQCGADIDEAVVWKDDNVFSSIMHLGIVSTKVLELCITAYPCKHEIPEFKYVQPLDKPRSL